MKVCLKAAAVAMLVVCLGQAVMAQMAPVPQQVNYQGKLLDGAGQPVNDPIVRQHEFYSLEPGLYQCSNP